MTTDHQQLLQFLDQLLTPGKIKDYCPNGLQVEGKSDIATLVTGVTASQALIDRAIELNADAILVHHGYFWKGENPCVVNMKRQRLKALLSHDINLFAYHLPLDIHPELGNNAQLANIMQVDSQTGLEVGNPVSVAMQGDFEQTITLGELNQRLENALGRKTLLEGDANKLIKTIAWCTGGGQSFIDLAAEQNIDVFVSGEVSEKTIHTAREMDIAFIAAGHHATERYGVKALGERVEQQLGIKTIFVDIDNPA